MRRTKLYHLGTSSEWRNSWAESGGLVWLDNEPHDMSPESLLHSDPSADLNKLAGRIGFIIGNDGPVVSNKWPDWMSAPTARLENFVSERVVQGLIDEGIPFRCAVEFPIVEIRSPALRKKIPPKYYALEVDPGIGWNEPGHTPLDLSSSDESPASHWSSPSAIKSQLKYETWNGSPLFCIKERPNLITRSFPRSFAPRYCDHRVTFLSMKDGWTNFSFRLLELI